MNSAIKIRRKKIEEGIVPEGYKKTKVGIIPKDWEVKKLEEISKLNKNRYNPKKMSERYKCIELEHIESESGILKDTTSSKKVKSTKSFFDEGDILFGKLRPYLKKYHMPKFKGICSTEIWVLRTKNKKLISQYLYYMVQTQKFNYVSNISTGTSMPRADWEYVGGSSFSIPNLQEQEKIANILSTWDKAIETIEKLIKEKEEQKKGLMQKLLTGETRLPGFHGEWEEVKLGEISKIQTGKLDANAMVENGQYKFFTCAKESYEIDNYAYDTEALLISGNGANVGYIHYYKGKFNAYQRTYILDSFNESILFIKFLLDLKLEKRISREKRAGNTPYITMGTLSEMELTIPPLQEQEAIADILSTADKEIELLNELLESKKHEKKGLMQLLLTGIVRV